MLLHIIVISSGFAFGLILHLLVRKLAHKQKMQSITLQANDMIEAAQTKADEMVQEKEESYKEFVEETQQKFEKNIEKTLNHIEHLKYKASKKQSELDQELNIIKKDFEQEASRVNSYSQYVKNKSSKLDELKAKRKKARECYIESLVEKSQVERSKFTKDLATQLEKETERKTAQFYQEKEELYHANIEKIAKRLLVNILSRFHRPYCAERSIGYITFKDERQKERFFGPDGQNVIALEKACGVDLVYNNQILTLSASGFDPVRRELARMSMEKFLHHQGPVKPDTITNIVKNLKKDLIKKIHQDGQNMAKELELQQLHPEIKNMMGSLRYRYSFTQNQYFHCIEVGHLCGLLAQELGIDIQIGRRAGLLHDIGKAMDHSLDGSHAVIGADFIEKYGEQEDVVHAVRAHHYDELPSIDLAFLVIAADAMSGARPGARRSTAVSYMQKMDQLTEIGNSFDGVIDTFILSAGREVRITVDSQQISDVKALDLSKDIAKKIEGECNYPGQIKVTVVRKTQAIEMAR